jgi:hypothetical protein
VTADLSRLEGLLSSFERAFPTSDPGIRSAIRGISDLAGAKGPMEIASVMRTHGNIPEEESGRTFFWLAEAARDANGAGRSDLPPRIFFLANFFKDLEGNLGIADFDDMHVDRLPDRAMASIASEALVSLRDLGPGADRVVVKAGEARIEAWLLGKHAADTLIALSRLGDEIDANILEFARTLTDGPSS